MLLRRTIVAPLRETAMSFVYNPIVHWPLSGSVTQDISPSLLLRARDAETEVRVLREVASYGKQIGKLSEVLLAVVKVLPEGTLDAKTQATVDELRTMAVNIERIKKEQKVLPGTLAEARALMDELKQLYPGL
jgi:hypothetical protein